MASLSVMEKPAETARDGSNLLAEWVVSDRQSAAESRSGSDASRLRVNFMKRAYDMAQGAKLVTFSRVDRAGAKSNSRNVGVSWPAAARSMAA